MLMGIQYLRCQI